MTGAASQHRLGIALVVAAAIAWSTAPFFTRLLAYDSWTILFWRGLFGGGLIAALMVVLVLPGLVPGIHVLALLSKKDVDGRDKPGHDERASHFRVVAESCGRNPCSR